MNKIFFLILLLFAGYFVSAQSWNPYTGKSSFTDSMRILKYAIPRSSGYALSIDSASHNLIFVPTGAPSSPAGVDSVTRDGCNFYFWQVGNNISFNFCKDIDSLPLNFDSTYILWYNNGTKLPDSTWLPQDLIYGGTGITITRAKSILQPLRDSILISATGGGGGSPAGSNRDVQYNDNGSFGADSNFQWTNSGDSSVLRLSSSSTFSNPPIIMGGFYNTTNQPSGLKILGGDAVSGSGVQGGSLQITGGAGDPTDNVNGGNLNITGGNAGNTGAGGQVTISGGTGGIIGGQGGNVSINTGSTNNNNQGSINLTSGNVIALIATNGVGINGAYILPNSDGTVNQVMTTNGAGVASWATAGGGSGSVTNIATGLGLSGGPITTTGTIIADTSYLLTKGTRQSITGRKFFNAQVFLNKDSTTAVSGKTTILTLDTTTWQVQRQQAAVVNLSSAQDRDILEYNTASSQFVNVALGTRAWTVTGNTGMAWGTNFLGTTDNQSLRFRTNNLERAKIDSTGKMFIDSKYIGSGIGANYASVGFGDGALLAITTGNNNTVIGDSAGRALTTGSSNTVLGSQALMKSTIGDYSTAIGYQAMTNTSTAFGFSTAIGYQSQLANTTGYDNVSVGFQTLYNNLTGKENLGLGYQSIYFNTSGDDNVGIGEASLHGNANFSFNTGIGAYALNHNTGNYNTAIGYQAGYGINSGVENVSIGYQTMFNNGITGNYNVAIGSLALPSVTSGLANTSIGRSSFFNLTSSSYSIALGNQAGQYSYRLVNGSGSPIDPLQRCDTCFLAGSVSSPASDSLSNVIVLGTWNAKSLPLSHSMMLGDSMNIATGIFGSVSIASTIIGTANASAQLDVSSTTKGLLPPRMTTTQKNAISSPAEGLMVYDLTLHKLCVYTGSAWETITSL